LIISDFGESNIKARQSVTIADSSVLSATNLSSGFAGDIRLTAPIEIAILGSSVLSQGNFGQVFIGDRNGSNSPKTIRINNSKLRTNSLVPRDDELDLAPTSNRAGKILINGGEIAIVNNSEITTRANKPTQGC
jgi:hypothetical protein